NDAFEPNNDPDTAALLTSGVYRGLAVCPSDVDDYYRIAARAGTRIVASARFRDSIADIDMRLLGPNGTTILTSSTSSTDDEEVSYTVPADDYYFLRVYRFSGAPNSYELTIEAEAFSFECSETDF